MDSEKLNSVLSYQFTTQNGDQNFEVSKSDGLGFFPPPPSLPSLPVPEMVVDTHVGGKSGKNKSSAVLERMVSNGEMRCKGLSPRSENYTEVPLTFHALALTVDCWV